MPGMLFPLQPLSKYTYGCLSGLQVQEWLLLQHPYILHDPLGVKVLDHYFPDIFDINTIPADVKPEQLLQGSFCRHCVTSRRIFRTLTTAPADLTYFTPCPINNYAEVLPVPVNPGPPAEMAQQWTMSHYLNNTKTSFLRLGFFAIRIVFSTENASIIAHVNLTL